MIFDTLISPEQVRQLLDDDAALAVLDASFDLADTSAGARCFGESHVPGARHVDLDRDLSGPKTGRNGRHPLPSRECFAASVGEWGITPAAQVVVYDRQGGMYAARAWWMLRWLGHDAVALLDGGLAAWQASGGKVESGEAASRPAAPPYPLAAPRVGTVDASQLALGIGRMRLIDARAPERYRGDVEPLDAQAGHIPGALNRFFKDNLGPDGRFKPREQLRAEFEPLVAGSTADRVVQQCGSGVTACHNLLAMAAAGLGTSLLYPGSWSEWSSDPARPVARS